MLEMDTGDELTTKTVTDATPLPIHVGERMLPRAQPTPAAVLQWISDFHEPWFPSRHAATTGAVRDAYDEPLAQLRLAGLIRIVTWVRGVGQGYVVTADGARALATGVGIPAAGKPPEPLSSGSLSAIPEDPALRLAYTSHLSLDPRPCVVVPALLIANVLWFFVGLVAAVRNGVGLWTFLESGNATIAHRFGSVSGDDLLRGEWWRLLTALFVHANGAHLLVNLFSLGIIGPLAELLWGRPGLAAIYLLAGLGGSCLAMTVSPQHAVVGASGAIWGVLMAVTVWFVVHKHGLSPEESMDFGRRLTITILANVGISLLPGISWESHLGGGVIGSVTAALLLAVYGGDARRRLFALALVSVLPAALVAGLVAASHRESNWIALRTAQRGANPARGRGGRPNLRSRSGPAPQPVDAGTCETRAGRRGGAVAATARQAQRRSRLQIAGSFTRLEGGGGSGG